MFDRVARRYDLLNDLMSAGLHHRWRRRAVAVSSAAGADVLDLATGTADLALAYCHAGARRVIGVDFSASMLDGAWTKLAAHPSARVGVVQGDAQALPFPDEQFDVVSSAFLLRNLSDLEGALREMRRVLRPEGRVIALDVTHPPSGPLGAIMRWYFSNIVPRLGGLVSGEWDAYRYLPASVEPLPSVDELAALLTEVGFRDVRYERLGLGSVALHRGVR